MEEIVNKKLVFDADEIKAIIKEHLLLKGVDVQIIEFYGNTQQYVNRDDYMSVPKINLKTVVCHSSQKEIAKKQSNEFIELTKFIYHGQIPVTEIKQPAAMMNLITYELINPELWEDGLHLYPNIMDKNLPINMVVEVKDKKVIKVYKND